MRRAAPPLALALSVALAGCMGGVRHTTTARAATEMLLVSTAAGRAVEVYDPTRLSGKRVALETAGLAALDRGYVESALRERLARGGALLCERAEAEVILEVRTAGHGINDPEWKLGIPSLPLGYSGVFAVTPEISAGYDPQVAWAKLQLFARDARTGEHLGRQVVWATSETGWFDDTWPSTLERIQKGEEIVK